MNSQEINNQNPTQDAALAKKSTQFLQLIQAKIALKSFDGARTILQTPYTKHLLSEQNIAYLQSQIDRAQANFKKDGNRIYWEWFLIFVFSAFFSAYLIWKYGVRNTIVNWLKVTSKAARTVIGAAVFAVLTGLGVAFAYLCKIVKELKNKIFG